MGSLEKRWKWIIFHPFAWFRPLTIKGCWGFPRWHSGKESACQFRRCGFNPWVRKIPWSRKWQPTPVSLPGKFHGQRSLLGYSPWGCKVLDTTEHTLYSSFQKVASTFIQESLTFLPQEGHLNTKSPCDIFMLLLLHALRMFPFCFSQIFNKLSRYSPWTLYFGIHEEKKKGELCYGLKNKDFLGFKYIKWLHSILGVSPFYIHIPLLRKMIPFKKASIICIMLHVKKRASCTF